jgi:glutamine synthetase
MLSFAELKKQAAAGTIDTVLVCMVDMQGRLMGKRFHVSNFIESGHEETHCCNYLLATDIEMATPDGYASTSWEKGYGDYVMKPDLTTLRPVPWLDGTAIVFCDLIDHHSHEPVPHAPRQILKTQVERAKAMGFTPMMATELEFFLFEKSFDDYPQVGLSRSCAAAGYNADYAIQLTTKEEYVMRPIRNLLVEAGVPVENSPRARLKLARKN